VTVQVRTPEEQLADAFAQYAAAKAGGTGRVGYKHNASGTPTTTYGHGPGGLFSYPGVDPQIFSAMLGIESGLIGALPKYPSVYTNPIFETITGVQADAAGSEPVNVCDPALVAGLLKACKQTSVFGRYRRQTREVYLNRLGQRTDYSDPTNLRLMNAFPAPADAVMAPALAGGLSQDVLNLEMAKILMEFGTSVNRLLAVQLWRGNPSNNTAGNGYKEMTGIDTLIGTGKIDAETGIACPAMDSNVLDFNYQDIENFTPSDIVEVLTYIYRYARTNARRMGLLPVEFAFAMREELFYELTAAWPCSYMTWRCNFRNQTGDVSQVVDSQTMVAFRDTMRRDEYLLIDGIQVPVILDDGIHESVSGDNRRIPVGGFASDIYLIPLTVLGGTPVAYMEYFQHDNADIAATLGAGHLAGQVWTTNNGAWIWSAERSRLCVFWEGKVEPRMILRTPQLAARLQNVAYTPLMHTRQPFPADPYFRDGGVTSRTGPSLYAEWKR
jgi:hypothetical protein